jgi:hypothetical protein
MELTEAEESKRVVQFDKSVKSLEGMMRSIDRDCAEMQKRISRYRDTQSDLKRIHDSLLEACLHKFPNRLNVEYEKVPQYQIVNAYPIGGGECRICRQEVVIG